MKNWDLDTNHCRPLSGQSSESNFKGDTSIFCPVEDEEDVDIYKNILIFT